MEEEVKGFGPNDPIVTQKERKRKRVYKTFLVVGATRMGKSTLINSLCGKTICEEGEPFGELQSTTYQITANKFNLDGYDDEEDYTIQIIDTIGFIDTRCQYTDREIGEKIMQELIDEAEDHRSSEARRGSVSSKVQVPDKIDAILMVERATH